jgi:hypothetical protein
MRGLVIIGVILILAGIGGLVVRFIPFHHQEQVAKIGPITATEDKETDIVIPAYVAVIVIVVGGALVFAGRRGA